MNKYWLNIRSFIAKVIKSPDFWYFLILALIFFSNALHQSYPDEFDNISGGRFILRGILPYSGFLSHHGPFAYYLAAVLNVFSGVSFVHFRFVYAAFLVSLFYVNYRLIRSRFSDSVKFLKPYFIIIGIMATYFWMHMLLADSLSALILILPYFYLLLLSISKKKLNLKDVLVVSIPLSTTLLTSLTYSFFVAGLYLFLAILWLKSGSPLFSKDSLKATGIVLMPYIIFIIYLFGTSSFSDYYYQNITYNQQYYIFNYSRSEGQTTINPIRYAVMIAKTALDSVADGSKHVFSFNIYTPKEIPLLGMNMFLILIFIITSDYLAIFPVILLLLFTTPRTDLMLLKEIDYQSAVYIVLSVGNGVFLLWQNLKRKSMGQQKDILLSASTLIISAYMLIFTFAMFQPFVDKIFKKYMGTEPTIYDRPEIASSLNLLVSKDEYAWVGPFAFEELYYMKAKFPSKYHWLLPANAKSEKIRTEMIADFEKNMPIIIVFDMKYSAFGALPSTFNYFMADFIDQNYTLVSNMFNEQGKKYRCNISKLRDFRCDDEFYIRNDKKEEVINKMLNLNLASINDSN